MLPGAKALTIGVEEEYQIIDPVTRKLSSSAVHVLSQAQQLLGGKAQPEIHLSQIEIATAVCQSLSEVRAELLHLRSTISAAAAQIGKVIAAAGSHPFSRWEEQQMTPLPRYLKLERDYQQLAREQSIFGCHVHIGLDDREAAIQVSNRARGWLAPLLALTANSPFWRGEETGYASFRTMVWNRWPHSGPPHVFQSLSEYRAVTGMLLRSGSIDDKTKIYWDIRLSERYNTIEFRIADACTTVDEAVMLAGIVRALVQTCYEQALRDEPYQAIRPELLRAAHWQAARYGLNGTLLDGTTQQSYPAHVLIEKLLLTLRPALEATNDWDEVSELVQRTLTYGNGADRQRERYRHIGQIERVVDFIVDETMKDNAVQKHN